MEANSVAPSLLDRLTDFEPKNKKESAHAAHISPRRMREILKRDISWLLATIRLEELVDLEKHDAIRSSVLNYGVRDMSGVPEQNINPHEVQETIRGALCKYEPRFDPSTVHVQLLDPSELETRGLVKMRITGQLLMPGYEELIHLEAKINFETGSIALEDG